MEATSPECDIASYVWKELANDTPSPSAWKGRMQSKNPHEAGGLYMKSRAFTPRTQRYGSCRFLSNVVAMWKAKEKTNKIKNKQTNKECFA